MMGLVKVSNGYLKTHLRVVAESIKEFFPDASPEALSRSISRYKDQNTWPTNPKLNEPEYQGLQTILMNAGLVKERQAYDG
ncbi:MAG: hypothetical protein CM1200mP15_12380 [Dehalococcoidia bacterium]|nr:MAG: hypothetical protein CM1200mP15_12380 [Dehalococcoidia bacterium]